MGFIGDELIATAHAISDLTSVAYLADVAIDPRFQGQGLGRRLMDRVMQDLAPLGKIFIYSVPEKLAFIKVRLSRFDHRHGVCGRRLLQRLQQGGYVR